MFRPMFLPAKPNLPGMPRFALIASLLFAAPLAAAAEKPVDFALHVQPILAARCMKCHGPSKASGGIAFDKPEHAFAESESGEKAIVPGKSGESELIKRITSADESIQMPPEGKRRTEAEVALIK